MKFNLLEDTVDGDDVKDGSINMHEEFVRIIRQLMYSNIGSQNPEVGALFESEEIPLGRIDIRLDESEKIIKWYLIGYYHTNQPIKKFEFSNKTIANGYRYLVNYILTNYPQIESYMDILKDYKIYPYDFDVFTGTGIISGRYFFDEEPEVKSKLDTQWPLNVYLRDVDEIAETYVLPYDIMFDPKFVYEHNRILKRTHQLAKLFQKGRFQDHDYSFEYYQINLSPSYKAYNNEKKIMLPKLVPAVTFYRLWIDEVPVANKIISKWDQEEKGTNPETEYNDALLAELKKRLSKFGIKDVY